MTYITVTHSFVSGQTCSAVSINSNFADLAAGLSDGTKDIYVNNVSLSSLTVGVSATIDSLVSTGTVSVAGMLDGDRLTVQYGCLWYGSPSNTVPIPYIIKNSSSLYSSVSGSTSGYESYSIGSHTFDAGDTIGVKFNTSGAAYNGYTLKPMGNTGEIYISQNNIGSIVMPRSGSVVNMAWYCGTEVGSPPANLRKPLSVILSVVWGV